MNDTIRVIQEMSITLRVEYDIDVQGMPIDTKDKLSEMHLEMLEDIKRELQIDSMTTRGDVDVLNYECTGDVTLSNGLTDRASLKVTKSGNKLEVSEDEPRTV